MPGHDVIVVGASAGGVEALKEFVRNLPTKLPAAIFVVLHVPPDGMSVLPDILHRFGPLPATHARDGQRIQQGHIYVAPPDMHLLVERDRVHVVHGPRVNGHRPAVDPLFSSAARVYRRRVVGVILSGSLDDGTLGLRDVKALGGVAIVQDPAEALYPGMPSSAIDNAEVDYVLPASEMGTVLERLAREQVPEEGNGPMPPDLEFELETAERDMTPEQNNERPGIPSAFTCPECGGTLWEVQDGELIRLRCRVGHAYGPESMLAEQSQALESALWQAVRALEERAAFARRLAAHARSRGHSSILGRFERKAAEADRDAEVIRRVLMDRGQPDRTVSGARNQAADPPHTAHRASPEVHD